jgi:cyclophilin family peptidyl-prolyl cis-trans isomerase
MCLVFRVFGLVIALGWMLTAPVGGLGQESEPAPPATAEDSVEKPADTVAPSSTPEDASASENASSEEAPPESTTSSPPEEAAETAQAETESAPPAPPSDPANEQEASSSASVADPAVPPVPGDWGTLFTSWKNILKELRDIRTEYNLAEDSELADLQQRWDAKIAEGNALIPTLEVAATAEFQEVGASSVDPELGKFLLSLAADHIGADNYLRAFQICQGLVAGKSTARELNDLAGIAAFGCNEFALAEAYFAEGEKSGSLSEQAQTMSASLAECKQLWETEKQLREKEAAADDLPRVLLKTSAGEITLELFENEAPETVGNFVNLVEKGFYDGLSFHRVMHGFMAQGGCPKGDGSGGPGYSIYCECYAENHRNHFAGSLSMAKETARNTGGSQFFITFVPTPHLNGKHTVFGRVIDGLETLPKITKTEGEQQRVEPEPTKIIEAKVLRKRDHEYVPKKVD